MATSSSKQDLTPNAKLVAKYIEVAGTRNADGWDFIKATRGLSVRVVADSIKQGKKDSGLALPDITPTKSQYFGVMLAMSKKWVNLESTVSFAKVYQIAEKGTRYYTAKSVESKINAFDSIEDFAKSLPKTVREKSPSEVSVSMAQFSTEQILEELNNRIPSDESDRAKFIRALTALAKIARALKIEHAA